MTSRSSKSCSSPRRKRFSAPRKTTSSSEPSPRTTFLDSTQIDLDHVRSEKDAWIIKPSDHYGADQVYAGCEVDQATWETLVDRFADGAAGYPFIVQQYIKPFKTETLPPDTNIAELSDDEVRVEPMFYNNLNGLYLYDGVFQGVFSRLGPPAYHFEGEPGDDRRDHLESTPTCTTESSSHEQERPSERDDGAHRPRSSPSRSSQSGFAVCAGIPATTEVLSRATSTEELSPFTRDQLVEAALATRAYTVEGTERDELADVVARINRDAATPYADATRAELDAAPDAYALTPDALDHLDDVHAVIERVMPALFRLRGARGVLPDGHDAPIPHPSRGTRALFRRLRVIVVFALPRRMGDDRLQQLLRRVPFAVLRGGNMDVPPTIRCSSACIRKHFGWEWGRSGLPPQ